MLRFYHSPGSCSDGILMLLEELGAPYQLEVVNVMKGEQRNPAFLATNPKGKVPALIREDGTVMTEFQSIAYWLACQFGEKGLWPADLDRQQRTLSALDFIVASLHMRGFTLVKVPQKFQLDEQGTRDLREFGKKEVNKCLGLLSDMLGDSDYLLGEFGLADTALFYCLRWADAEEGIEMAPNLKACFKRLAGRPSAARVLAF